MLLERLEPDCIAQQGIEEGVGLLAGQRVEAELGIVGFVPPTVLVLRAIGEQEQEVGRRQTLDEEVEAGLRLGVQPVEIFQDHEQGLRLAGPEQELLDGLERLLAALGGIEGLPRGASTGTSRSVRMAGTRGMRAVSRLRSLVVTWSQIAGTGSRSSSWK